ncbi:MAG TPA: hypothetical protein VGR02_20530 [Thermoanaerobaculia bacterium]|nr:hypothetical protein [Thermoanaerobaculia bacterium]
MRRIAILLLLALAPLARAQDLLGKLLSVRTFHQVAIAPDGGRVGWAVKEGGLWVDGKKVGEGDVTTFAFSPDSKRVAWFAKRKLYVDGREVATVKGSPDMLRWSPGRQADRVPPLREQPRGGRAGGDGAQDRRHRRCRRRAARRGSGCGQRGDEDRHAGRHVHL